MELFRMKLKNGGYQHAGFCGTTKDKNLAIMPMDLVNHYSRLYDDTNEYTIESVVVDLKPCEYKSGAFEQTQNAFVIAETKSAVYVVKTTINNAIAFSSIEKLSKKNHGTVGLQSSGYKMV